MPNPTEPETISQRVLAARIGCSQRTLSAALRDGRLPAYWVVWKHGKAYLKAEYLEACVREFSQFYLPPMP